MTRPTDSPPDRHFATERRRVMVLHTGGTLGMRGAPLEPAEFAETLLEQVPEIGQLAELDSRIVCNLDSSDIGPEHWTILADAIAEARADVDGFVIIHGTDTMAYTASALTFALQGLDKPVILTGAQRPLAALRTDARRNLADAVELATRDIPEVGICFDGVLLRGCRSTKRHAREYRAFESPGCPPLARLGVDIEAAPHIRRPDRPFGCDSRFDPAVLVVHVIPGMRPAVLEAALTAPDGPRGVVLAAFGLGTVPTRTRPLAPIVARGVDAGIEVLVVTQASGRVDLEIYANSRPLVDAGASSGGGMRMEAAVTKLMHALATHTDPNERRAYLETDMAGEHGADPTRGGR